MLRFDNHTDSNQLLETHFYWTLLTAIVSTMFVLTIIKKMLYCITLSYILIITVNSNFVMG